MATATAIEIKRAREAEHAARTLHEINARLAAIEEMLTRITAAQQPPKARERASHPVAS